MEKSCDNCKYAIYEDYGYSNYTVEGTEFQCGKKAHPEGAFDRFYRENPSLNFGAQCEFHEAGEPISMDVEHEDYPELTDEQKAIFDGR